LVPPEDADALASAIRRLCLDVNLRQRMAAARPRAQQFSWERMVDAYERLYREVVDGAKAGCGAGVP